MYRVARGDYLGEVAERYLDDFGRYRELARLNKLADPDRIRPGQLLKLPDGGRRQGARRHASGRLVRVRPASRPAPAGHHAGHPRRPCRPAAGRSGLADHPGASPPTR